MQIVCTSWKHDQVRLLAMDVTSENLESSRLDGLLLLSFWWDGGTADPEIWLSLQSAALLTVQQQIVLHGSFASLCL